MATDTALQRIRYPSLSTDGWVNDPVRLMDYLFSMFFLTDYSQSNSFMGNISSFPKILAEHDNDLNGLVAKTRETLSTYFSRYFNSVVVEVTEQAVDDHPSKRALTLYINVKDADGKDVNMGMVARYSGPIMQEVFKIVNA